MLILFVQKDKFPISGYNLKQAVAVDSMPADFKRELDKLINNCSVMTVKKFHNCSAI